MKTFCIRAPLLTAAIAVLTACSASAPAKPEQLSVKVEGMHCESCAEGITKKLAQTRGVLGSDVHFSNAVQTVRYDAARIAPEAVIALITNRGFTVTRTPP